MFRAQSSLPHPPHLAHPTRTPSLLSPSHGDVPCDPHPGAQVGRLAEQGPFTAYEPNDLTEVNNPEVPHIFFQRRTSRASTCNSGEDIAHTPMDSKVDDAQIVGMLASQLYTQERERQVQTHHEFITLTEKVSCQVHHFSDPVQGNLRQCSKTKESEADNIIPREREISRNIKKFGNSWKYEQIEQLKEHKKLCPNSLKRNIRRSFFLKNKEIRYSHRRKSNEFCRKRDLSTPLILYKI